MSSERLEEQALALNRRRMAKGLPDDLLWCRWMVAAAVARQAYIDRHKQMLADQKKVFDEASDELDRLDLLSRVANWRATYRSEPNEEDMRAILEGFRP